MTRQAVIPGGSCQVRSLEAVTGNQRRAVLVHLACLGIDRLKEIVEATGDTTEALTDEIDLTPHEEALLMGLNDAVAWALIDSWTLPTPLPRTVEALGALPTDLREALHQATRVEGVRLVMAA